MGGRHHFISLVYLSALLFSSSTLSIQSLVVYTELSPPFQTFDGNNVEGIATERVLKILNEAGLSSEIKMVPWARALKKVEESNNTLLYSVGRTQERENQFYWIAPVARYEMSFVGLAERNDIKLDSWQALNNYSIAVQRHDISYKWLKSKGLEEDKQLLVCPDIACSWRFVMSGHVDLMLEDASLIESTANDFGYDPARLRAIRKVDALSVDAYLVAPKTMSPELVARLKRAAEN